MQGRTRTTPKTRPPTPTSCHRSTVRTRTETTQHSTSSRRGSIFRRSCSTRSRIAPLSLSRRSH
jgi:hypothetical protein